MDIAQYRGLAPARITERLNRLSADLGPLRVLHVNSTATGGGVAEILQSVVPFMNALGFPTEWLVINPPQEFFRVTKRIHNLLQGADGVLSSQEAETYLRSISQVAEDIRRDRVEADVWFLHDPQLLPLAGFLPRPKNSTRLWVCHIDLTAPNRETLDQLLPLTQYYDGLIMSMSSYVPYGLDAKLPVYIVPPAIDPLTEKNVSLDEAVALQLVASMGIDPARPLVSQISRFDPWKDPWGVIDAFRLARESVPGLQLAMLGLNQASDDPEAQDIVSSVQKHAAQDPDIHIYFDPKIAPDTIDRVVNAFQAASRVVIQKSLREGFGLTVTEAMWKGKAVVGGDVGGIRLQIDDGVNGYRIASTEDCGHRIVQLMRDSQLRTRLGQSARESVRERFLLPRLALDYLEAAQELVPSSNSSPAEDFSGSDLLDTFLTPGPRSAPSLGD